MKKNILITILFFFSYQTFAQTQTFKSDVEVRGFSKKLSNLFLEEKLTDFFKSVKLYWPLPENEIDNLEEKTIKNMNVIKERFGKGFGTAKVKEEKVGDFGIRETYIVKYTYHSVRLIFTYYKNPDGWFLNGFKWDDLWTEEFK